MRTPLKVPAKLGCRPHVSSSCWFCPGHSLPVLFSKHGLLPWNPAFLGFFLKSATTLFVPPFFTECPALLYSPKISSPFALPFFGGHWI